MSRPLTEQQVLKKLKIEDFRHLTKDKGKRIVSGCSPEKTGILARDARHASILL